MVIRLKKVIIPEFKMPSDYELYGIRKKGSRW
jgi:hypothetical protein